MNTVKKCLFWFVFTAFTLLFAASFTSCAKKSGCPVNETVGAKTNKRGEFSTKRGSSNLFPKDMRAKKKKG